MPRRRPLFSDLDPWFEGRGYTRPGRKSRWKKTLTRGIELQVEADAVLRWETEPETSVMQWVGLPQYVPLERAAIAGSSFRGDPGNDAALVLKPRDLAADRPLEIDGSGPKWDAFLPIIGPVLEANEARVRAHADDLRPLTEDPYFALGIGPYSELYLMLHAGDFGTARTWIDQLDYEPAINPHNLKVDPGQMTAEEEYQQARRLFHEYIDTHDPKTA